MNNLNMLDETAEVLRDIEKAQYLLCDIETNYNASSDDIVRFITDFNNKNFNNNNVYNAVFRHDSLLLNVSIVYDYIEKIKTEVSDIRGALERSRHSDTKESEQEQECYRV